MDMDATQDLSLSLPLCSGYNLTEVQLLHYLRRKVLGLPIDLNIIPELDIYKHEPWDLPDKSSPLGSNSGSDTNSKWYFITPRERKYPNSSHVNRTTQAGYWKSNSNIRAIYHNNQILGIRKSFVFVLGRYSSSTSTEWVMHEYTLHEDQCKDAPHIKDLVLCRIIKRHAKRSEELPAPNQLGADQLTPATIYPDPVMPDSSSTLSETPIASSSANNNYQHEDLEKWLQELFDPNFTAASILPELQQHATTPALVRSTPSVPSEGSKDENNFLFQEEIQSILGIHDHQKTQNHLFLDDETACTSSAVYTNLVGYNPSAPKPS